MSNTRFALISGLVTAILVAGIVGVRVARPSPTLHAFVATQTLTTTTSRQPQQVIVRTVAVRSDGSTSILTHSVHPLDGSTIYIKNITDVSAAKRVVVEPLTGSRATFPLSPAQVAAVTVRPGTCRGTSAGEMFGFHLWYSEIDEHYANDPDERLVKKSWEAEELNCTELRYEKTVSYKGELVSFSTSYLSNVKLGEPPQWMFEVPTNYVERLLPDISSELHRRFPWRSPQAPQ